jgi:hypothetical protein
VISGGRHGRAELSGRDEGATIINRAGADVRELLLQALSDEIVHS